MKAIVVVKHGAPEVLKIEERERPVAGAGEVVISVRSAGVNFADVLARLGVYDAAPPPPFIPGIEVAGTVEEAGAGVENVAPGDRVMAFCPFGGYAEAVKVPASFTFKIPESMTFFEASAFPVQYLTAWYGLVHLAHVEPGETVLIHAAAGGVGIACLQLCRHLGARVFATVGSPSKVDLVKEECPDARVILYREEDFSEILRRETGKRGMNVVMDSIGGSTFRKGWKLLAPGGRYVLYGAASAVKPGAISKLAALFRLLPMMAVNPLRMIGDNKGLFGFNLFYLAGESERLHAAADYLLDLREKGILRPKVRLSLPLEKAHEAHRRLQERTTTGKVILTVSS